MNISDLVDDLLARMPGDPAEFRDRIAGANLSALRKELVERVGVPGTPSALIALMLMEIGPGQSLRRLEGWVRDPAEDFQRRTAALFVIGSFKEIGGELLEGLGRSDAIALLDGVEALAKKALGELPAPQSLELDDEEDVPKQSLPAACRMKVTLRDVHPPVWRRIEVGCGITFAQLHEVVQRAMGWTDTHLHLFEVEGMRFGQPDPEWPDVKNEKRIRLVEILRVGIREFVYEYDFGDDWIHDIVVEQLFDPEPGAVLPRCTAGKRASPPEDSGGPWGYAEHLANRGHDGEEEWLAEDFDPESFDLAAVNEVLRPLAKRHARSAPRVRKPRR